MISSTVANTGSSYPLFDRRCEPSRSKFTIQFGLCRLLGKKNTSNKPPSGDLKVAAQRFSVWSNHRQGYFLLKTSLSFFDSVTALTGKNAGTPLPLSAAIN